MRPSPFAADLRADVPDMPGKRLPMNEEGPFNFESDLFVGKAYVRVTGTKDVGDDYFHGKRRRMQATVQGQFKTELSVDGVLTGQALNRPLTNVPHQTIVKGALAVLSSLSPGANIDVTSDRPCATSILAGTAQAIDVSVKGEEPDITSGIQENNKLFGDTFSSSPGMSDIERRKFFQSPVNAKKYQYKTDLVYTFDFYQDRMDPAKWILDFKIKHFKLARYLNQQPIQVMSMTPDRQFLYNFEIWHECLLDESLVQQCSLEEEDSHSLTHT